MSEIAWLPNIAADGTISWSRSDTDVPPPTTNIKGPTGTIGPKGNTGDRGEKGDTGPQGEKGDTGPKGNPGNPGARGEKGEKGETGEPGVDGEPGLQGDQGPQGEKGDPGTDGVGVAAGGTEGQALVKATATDYDTAWQTLEGTGDMMAADYDPQEVVKNAGGMVSWLEDIRPFKNNIFAQTTVDFPANAVTGDILMVYQEGG